MSASRTLLVGGLSSIHDPILAAALRGAGLPAVPLHARTDAGLRLARGLGNHGQCNPAHYAVGAVLEQALASGEPPAAFAREHAWLSVGSCGPCRLAAFRFEYERVLAGAGLGALSVELIDQLGFAEGPAEGPLSRLGFDAAKALLLGLVAGDVVAALGHQLRPYVRETAALEARLARGRDEVAEALEGRRSPLESLRRLGDAARALELDGGRTLPRVLLVGEPWTTLADGDPSYDLARRLELQGAELEVGCASDWLAYLLWERRRDGAPLPEAERRLGASFAACARAVGLARTRLVDQELLAALAGPHYALEVRGGSGHLEVGLALLAARERSAHLVLSLKPFGCLPSSSLSDGISSQLLRAPDAPLFLAVETSGDADAIVDSRVEMALHGATLAALRELDGACAARGIDVELARRALAAEGVRSIGGPRSYACTAAERIRRLDQESLRRAQASSCADSVLSA